MASIVVSVVGCIDYLAYGTIFTRVTFRPKIKLDVFFPRQKSPNERREVVGPFRVFFMLASKSDFTKPQLDFLPRNR
jgi:hypothetical protein